MDHLVAAALVSPEGRAVVASGEAGAVVRLIRKVLGWTQQDLADRSGYSQATISRIECGKTRAARDTDVLADFAQVLDVPPADLAAHERMVALATGQGKSAEAAARCPGDCRRRGLPA